MTSGIWTLEQVPFECIVQDYSLLIHNVAFSFLRDKFYAEDITQEVLLKLFTHHDDISSYSHLVPWLLRVTANLCIDEKRKRARFLLCLDSIPEPIICQPDEDFLAYEQVRKAINGLPEKSKTTLELRFLKDLKINDIATTLQEPQTTIKSRLQNSLKFLKKSISNNLQCKADPLFVSNSLDSAISYF